MLSPPYFLMVVSADREKQIAPLSVTIHCVCPSALVGLLVEQQSVRLFDVKRNSVVPLSIIGLANLHEVVAVNIHHTDSTEG